MREFRLAHGARAVIIATADTNPRQPCGTGTQEGRMSGTLKIRVDQDKCQGHARCKSLAPELFELDEYGNAHEVGDGTVPKGLEEKAGLAPTHFPQIPHALTPGARAKT